MHAAQDSLNISTLGLSGLHRGLIVHGEVVEQVFRRRAIHAPQAIAHNVSELEAKGWVVVHRRRIGGSEERRVAVLVLEALSVERGAAGGGANDEATSLLVAREPEGVSGALKPEH